MCFLAICSRVLGRVLAKRLAWWTKHLRLLDENHVGFRKRSFTADAVHMMVRLQEEVVECRRRERRYANEARMGEDKWPSAKLLDFRKAYPRVNKSALWMLL